MKDLIILFICNQSWGLKMETPQSTYTYSNIYNAMKSELHFRKIYASLTQ